MSEQMWRFPDNNYTNENGLDTSDMEMFKKDPVSIFLMEFAQILRISPHGGEGEIHTGNGSVVDGIIPNVNEFTDFCPVLQIFPLLLRHGVHDALIDLHQFKTGVCLQGGDAIVQIAQRVSKSSGSLTSRLHTARVIVCEYGTAL